MIFKQIYLTIDGTVNGPSTSGQFKTMKKKKKEKKKKRKEKKRKKEVQFEICPFVSFSCSKNNIV